MTHSSDPVHYIYVDVIDVVSGTMELHAPPHNKYSSLHTFIGAFLGENWMSL